MRDNDLIVSKTDTKGLITYCNPIFIEFSGYTEQELICSQHNIVRHPDMPRAAFKLASALDQTETAFREILGGSEASSQNQYFRRLQTSGLHGEAIEINNLSDMEREAINLAQSGKWSKGSVDRDALIEIYDKLFSNIESEMNA